MNIIRISLNLKNVIIETEDYYLRRTLERYFIREDISYDIQNKNFIVNINFYYKIRNESDIFSPFKISEDLMTDTLRKEKSKTLKYKKKIIDEILKSGEDELLLDYDKSSTLDPHQKYAVEAASHPVIDGICIFDEQGLGKTVEGIFSFDRLVETRLVNKVLILAPKSVLKEWEKDFNYFFKGKYKVKILSGNKHDKVETLNSDFDVILANYESVNTVKLHLENVIRKSFNNFLMIVDESFYLKNKDAKRSKGVGYLRKFVKRCIVLCGTPAPNNAKDIIEQISLADGGEAFMGKDNVESIEDIVSIVEENALYLRRTKEEVLNLPNRTIHKVICPMSIKQKDIYSQYRNNLIREVSNINDEDFSKNKMNYLAKRSMLLQICSNPKNKFDDYDETPAKHHAIDQLVQELVVKNNEKIIIWSFYKKSIEELLSRYDEYKPLRYDGTITSTKDRGEIINLFQNDPVQKILIANPAAAGAGVTLHSSRIAIYESMSNQTAHFLQSLDRIHRRGQEREVEYFMLYCENSIEKRNLDTLLQKLDDSKKMLNDPDMDIISRESFINSI